MMITYKSDMVILGIIKAFLKISLFWFGTVAVIQNAVSSDIFDRLTAAMPSKVLMFFGFFYLVFITIKKGHDTFTHIQLNRMKMNKEKQKVMQEEIHTESDANKLNKK